MKDNIQFLLIIGLMLYIIFLRQCEGSGGAAASNEISLDTIINIDTIFPAPVIVKLPPQPIPQPFVVYVDSNKQHVPIAEVDTFQHLAVQHYQDSVKDDNVTLYYSSLVDGQLLNQQLDYKLHVPKLITKTIEIPKPIPMPTNQLLLNAGVGGNLNQFASVTVGLQFVSKKKWAVGYDYDILQNTHHLRLGLPIWRQKK